MKRFIVCLCVLGIQLVFHLPAVADVEIPRSVVGSGGGALGGVDYVITGSTLGQPVIGVVSGPSNTHQIGFWYPGFILTPVAERENILPLEYEFGQNYPNPFNPVTTIQFSVPKGSHVSVKLYDVNGREVRTLVDEDLDPGHYNAVLDAEGLSSGVYFCRMTAGGFVESRKLVLLK